MSNLPNAKNAIIELGKLSDYCLSMDHPRGRHKARVFQEALGLTAEDAAWLRQEFLNGVLYNSAQKMETDVFGDRWQVDLPLTRQGNTVVVRTGWIVIAGEQIPRLVTCWVMS